MNGEKKLQSPCHKCEDRRHGCHSECEKYMAFWLQNRKREAEKKKRFLADELLIRSVEKGLAIKRAMKGKMH